MRTERLNLEPAPSVKALFCWTDSSEGRRPSIGLGRPTP